MVVNTKKYARRRKSKLIASFILLVTLVMMMIFFSVAFLGSQVGRYTIQLKSNNTYLALDSSPEFTKPTTLLRADSLEKVYPIMADSLPPDEEIDDLPGSHNGEYRGQDGKYVHSLYFAYTFYIKNLGVDVADYQVWIKLNTTTSPSETSIDEYLRVRIYENEEIEGQPKVHQSKTLAKRTNLLVYNDDNEPEYRECIARTSADNKTCEASKAINQQRADEFLNVAEITRYEVQRFEPETVIRYTIVIWLEGDDPDCQGLPPENATLEFSMDISSFTGSETNSSSSENE